MHGPVGWKLDQYRRRLGLGPIRELEKVFPALAHIATLPECLDFPLSTRPILIFITPALLWIKAPGRPLIFRGIVLMDGPGSMSPWGPRGRFSRPSSGSSLKPVMGLGLQVVMSLGGRRDPAMFDNLPGDPLIVREAPQFDLIKIAGS